MNSTSITSKIAICAAIVGSALAFTPAHAHQNNDTDNNVQTSSMTDGQVQEKVIAAGYKNIERIKAKRNAYEVTAVNDAGQRVEIYLDSATGDVVRTKIKSDQNHTDRHSAPNQQS